MLRRPRKRPKRLLSNRQLQLLNRRLKCWLNKSWNRKLKKRKSSRNFPNNKGLSEKKKRKGKRNYRDRQKKRKDKKRRPSKKSKRRKKQSKLPLKKKKDSMRKN